MKKNLYILLAILTSIFLISTAAICKQCQFQPAAEIKEEESKDVEITEEEAAKEEKEIYPEIKPGDSDCKLIYFEVGIDEKSTHFEHRIAKIFSINPDGTDRTLIYSNINQKYDLGRVFNISPDRKKISCELFEGGRGAYFSICMVDIEKGILSKLVEFDYTKSKPIEILEIVYGIPIWSNRSKEIAFETISKPFTDNFRDGGIHIVDVSTGDVETIDLRIEGESFRSTLFLSPVLFSKGNQKLFTLFHPYYPKTESGNVLDYFTKNEELIRVNINSGKVKSILTIDEFEVEGAGLDNFIMVSGIEGKDRFVFQVLGEFEEDGDIWICDTDGDNLAELTSDSRLREQQPSVMYQDDSIVKIAYAGVPRYGVQPDNISSGDIYVIDLERGEIKRITDYGVGAAKPVVSPDGRYIAYMHYIYDKNYKYVKGQQIEVYDLTTSQIKTVVSGNGIFDLVGWI